MRELEMTNKEYILKITDKDKSKRIRKILNCITQNYVLQVAKPTGAFPTNEGIVNIIIPARVQRNKIAVIAHHDIHPNSCGYNDNSTGVVTLLKLQTLLPDNVELVFTDGEERGGQGCRYYLDNFRRPDQAINIDVVGLAGQIFYEMYGDADFDVENKYLTLYKNIPFSDSYILADYKIPNILMLTGKSKKTLITDIFNAQHGGKNDSNLALISEDSMNRVFGVLFAMLVVK